MKFDPQNTRVAVLGGGNIGTHFACVFASKGYRVNVASSRPERYNGTLVAVNETGSVTTGVLNKVCRDIAEAVDRCRVVFVTYPASMLRDTAARLLPHVRDGMYIIVVPGTGGAEFAFKECIARGAVLSGLQRVPAVARLEEYGRRVRYEGLRAELFLGAIPRGESAALSEFMSSVWGIRCTPLPNYLNVTLTPSNPILHTTRLRTMFADYKAGKVYDKNPLFYGEWDDASSELLIACDGELQKMLKEMDKLDLSYVRSLKEHYESDTAEAMTRKLCSIKSLHNLRSPMKRVEGGWAPDFTSRYFSSDFPYGLSIIEQMANIAGCNVPNIRETMAWYRNVTGDTGGCDLAQYGIRSADDIYSLY